MRAGGEFKVQSAGGAKMFLAVLKAGEGFRVKGESFAGPGFDRMNRMNRIFTTKARRHQEEAWPQMHTDETRMGRAEVIVFGCSDGL
jgi:hypothetical protein